MTVILRRCVLGTMTCLAFSAAAFFLQGGSAHADPAVGTPQWLRQPDGTLFQARLWGDEFAHGWETLEGYSILRSEPSGHWVYAKRDPSGRLAATGPVVVRDSPLGVVPKHERPSQAIVKEAITARAPGPGAQAGPPQSGAVNIPVLLIEFPDKGNIKTAADFQSNLFGGGATGPGDLKDYYKEISYNGLTLSSGPGGIPNWVTANNNRSYYNTYDRVRGLVTEAIQKADAAGFNFAPYDNDSDGSVDAVVVVYAGCGPDVGAWCADPPPDAMWPHQWTLAAPVTVDGKQASVYTIQPELLWSTTIRTIGVFAHELGHTFGLPDLYDTVPGGTSSDAEGIGHWGLMGTGSWTSNNPGTENGESPAHMSAWEKWFMGWVSPILLQGSTNNSSISQVETTSTVYQLLSNPNGVDWRFGSSGTGEYFLVENRQQTGFDQGLDGCGLLIWHVDESRPGDNTANGDETHKLVDLEDADGLNDLDNMTNRGDAGDPYRGSSNNTTFSDASTPSSNLYSGVASGASVSDISAGCTNPMTADLSAPSGGTTTRVSVPNLADQPSLGTQGNLDSNLPDTSADGRFVAFESQASNLVPGDTNSRSDVFVYDRQKRTTVRVSVRSDGAQGNDSSREPAISPDGRYVAFHSWASNLVSGDTKGLPDIFVHDRDTDGDGAFDEPGAIGTVRVSVRSDGTEGNGGESYAAAISTDGRYVAFQSSATNLVAGDNNSTWDVFVHDRDADGDTIFDEPGAIATARVSLRSNGTEGNGASYRPAISADARFVAFESGASNLVSGDTNATGDVFVHDRDADGDTIFDEPTFISTVRVSVDSSGNQGNGASTYPAISGDGPYVAFRSLATNLAAGDTNGWPDAFVHDQQTGATTRVSVDTVGGQGNHVSECPAISPDGRYVAFASQASNLINNDTNGRRDVFVHERGTEGITVEADAEDTVTTDTESDGATAWDPVETSVTTPNAGTVSIEETGITATPPAGFQLLAQQVNITAPTATSANPLVIALRTDSSQVPLGENQNSTQIFRDGVQVPACTGASGVASPDPCVSDRALLPDADIEITVLTSTASAWNLGVAVPAPPVGGLAELPDVGGWSGVNYAAIASGLATAALALTAGAWYARRRLLR